MPILTIFTNLSKDKIAPELNLHLAQVLANTLGKPISYCSVHILTDQNLSFGGTFEPCAQVQVMSIGKLGVEENKKHSNIIMSELESKLGIPATRAYILFTDASPSQVGYNKSTFA